MNSQQNAFQDVKSLSPAQKAALKKSNFKEISDVVLTPPGEISKRLKTSLSEAQAIVENVCKEIARTSIRVDRIGNIPDDKLTTGDTVLDEVIGGGIRTGMLWELAGESASGKTQLALQLSLLVQLRPMLGGLSGSACYLTTREKLSTKRLNQLIADHPLLSPSVCSLSDIHTVAVPTSELLLRTLKVTFPALQDNLREDTTRKPVRLIVIDSISSLFHTSEKSSSSTLFERSKALSELSRIMHTIAARDNIAFVIINEVTDVFNDLHSGGRDGASEGDILYRDQAKWFNSAHSIPQERTKEAGLGLVWANQLNVRIMLTRTSRRKYLGDLFLPSKRRKDEETSTASRFIARPLDGDDNPDQFVLLRRFSVVFSSLSCPRSVDFILTNAGISTVPGETSSVPSGRASPPTRDSSTGGAQPLVAEASPSRISESQASQGFISAHVATETLPPEVSSEVPPLGVIPSTFPEVDELDDDGLWQEFDELTHDELDFVELETSLVEKDGQPAAAVASPAETA